MTQLEMIPTVVKLVCKFCGSDELFGDPRGFTDCKKCGREQKR